jgi:hypothetical protein
MQVKLRNMLRRIVRGILLAVLFVACLSGHTARSEGNEYNIKAMFVLNFIKYIQWPGESTSNYFRIGVIGKCEMYDALKSMANNMNETKQIKIEEINDLSKEQYKIIVISKCENKRTEEILKKYRNKGVLLISDEFTGKSSAAINLVNINNKIRFELSISAAQEEGIKISSKLVDLAYKVKE